MATATHGIIGEFDSAREDWVSYTERLEQYFTANDIKAEEEDKRRAILLSVCGASTYQLIRNLVSPSKPTDKTFAQLVKLVQDHHQPPPSAIVQRKNFHTRVRREGETISQFIASLRKLSEYCNFGESLDEMLRDRIVCGCNDKRLQCKLLAEGSQAELTFNKAQKLALAFESAERESRDLQQPIAQPTQIHVLKSKRHPTNSQFGRKKPVATACYRCGGKHSPAECRFKDTDCHYCGKKGHIAKVCHSKARDQKKPQKKTQESTHQVKQDDSSDSEFNLYHTSANLVATKPYTVTVQINRKDLSMEIDSGATFSIISNSTYKTLWPGTSGPKLRPANVPLKTYTRETIKVLGSLSVNVAHNGQLKSLPLLVVAGNGPSLLGRDWLSQLQLDWHKVNHVHSADSPCKNILDRHSNVFKDELGQVQGATAKFHVNSDCQPKFCKARPVPYALRAKVEAELDRLEKEGILEPVEFSDWAAPIVPVVKRDGSVRICGDYKLTVNQAASTDTYPLPRIEDLFTSLSGGKLFSKLDLAHAYQQVPLDEDSKKYTTVNTHKGLYHYTRLPFGVASAPAIFQRIMDNMLRGLPHVCIYLDDILVTGVNDDEHLRNLDVVLNHLEKAGVRLKLSKCEFMLPSVEYLGHRITAQGLKPTDEKIQAIRDAPTPTNVSQLKSFLGLLNYYGKFLPNLSSALAPLYSLLQQKKVWCWGPAQEKAFQKAKVSLTSDSLLVHYDPSKELVLACDASPYGIGAVLSHRMENGSDQPIAFSSRSLAPAEKKYSQLDKEALAIIFGVKRFHQYLYGRHFTIVSDHKPLQHLFSESSAIPTLASARIQRWALVLSAYDYHIEYKPGLLHGNADMLSRLPLSDTPTSVTVPGETILLMDMLNSLPVTAAQIKQGTDRDPVLSKVRTLLLTGWKDITGDHMKPFQQRQNELSVQDGCVLWGTRVVVPPQLREKVLQELHEGHPGASRMKSLARSFVWWPGMDKDIEDRVKACEPCQRSRHLPAAAPLQPWEWPQRPWARVHIDYAGPFMGRMFLILVDAHSKWLEVKSVSSATTSTTVEQLRAIFATHGLPEMLVSDNGSVFTSAEFKSFIKNNGIRHATSAPYHPASNGLAERAVQTFKESMKKMSNGSIETRLSRFLFTYRTTPHTTTGISPAELLFNQRPRTRLELLRPCIQSHVLKKQQNQKVTHDKSAKARKFQVQDRVYARNFSDGEVWIPGVIAKCIGPLSFIVKLEDGRTIRRHIDHLQPRFVSQSSSSSDPSPEWIDMPTTRNDDYEATEDNSTTPSTVEIPVLRRSTRVSVPPVRFDPRSS